MDELYDVYYEKYTLLHSLYGGDRTFLSPVEYQTLDRELLALLEASGDRDLTVAEIGRIKEIEYLLMDDVAEGFFR